MTQGNLATKLVKRHPEWVKAKYMNAPLTSIQLIQVLALPIVLFLATMISFNQFYQPQRTIESNETISSVEVPERSYDFGAEPE